MPAVNKATEFLSGKLYWAKVIGQPRPNYSGDAREWTFEFEPDEDGLAVIKGHKLTDRLKDKYEDRGKYLTLRKAELSRDGNANPPIRVYNKDNEEWEQNTLIGNGSKADVKLDIRDYGPGKKKGVYPVAIRVTDLIPYISSEFGAMDKDDEGTGAANKPAPKKSAKQAGLELDDDIPF